MVRTHGLSFSCQLPIQYSDKHQWGNMHMQCSNRISPHFCLKAWCNYRFISRNAEARNIGSQRQVFVCRCVSTTSVLAQIQAYLWFSRKNERQPYIDQRKSCSPNYHEYVKNVSKKCCSCRREIAELVVSSSFQQFPFEFSGCSAAKLRHFWLIFFIHSWKLGDTILTM